MPGSTLLAGTLQRLTHKLLPTQTPHARMPASTLATGFSSRLGREKTALATGVRTRRGREQTALVTVISPCPGCEHTPDARRLHARQMHTCTNACKHAQTPHAKPSPLKQVTNPVTPTPNPETANAKSSPRTPGAEACALHTSSYCLLLSA